MAQMRENLRSISFFLFCTRAWRPFNVRRTREFLFGASFAFARRLCQRLLPFLAPNVPQSRIDEVRKTMMTNPRSLDWASPAMGDIIGKKVIEGQARARDEGRISSGGKHNGPPLPPP